VLHVDTGSAAEEKQGIMAKMRSLVGLNNHSHTIDLTVHHGVNFSKFPGLDRNKSYIVIKGPNDQTFKTNPCKCHDPYYAMCGCTLTHTGP
jgi:hypothetical protein